MEIAKSKYPGEFLKWNDIQKIDEVYLECVANETMRLAPPAQGTFRAVITDFTYEGFTIPKGWKTYWSVHTTNRNPKYFPDPEKFDPQDLEEKALHHTLLYPLEEALGCVQARNIVDWKYLYLSIIW
ncbi:hypothetical protein AAG906_020894 [Vitis piasezkii]